jgi:hypothetical protein
VNARGRVTLGFVGSGPDPSGKALWCARASRAGRFAAPRLVGGAGEPAFDVDAMSFGSGAAGSVIGLAAAGARTVVSLDPACRRRGSAPLDSALGLPAQYMVDARGRTWVIGQDRSLEGGIESRPDLRLQIVTPPR